MKKVKTKEVAIKSSRPVNDGMCDEFSFMFIVFAGEEYESYSFAIFSGSYDTSFLLPAYYYVRNEEEREYVVDYFCDLKTNAENLRGAGYNVFFAVGNGFSYYGNKSALIVQSESELRSVFCFYGDYDEKEFKKIKYVNTIENFRNYVTNNNRELIGIRINGDRWDRNYENKLLEKFSFTFIEDTPFGRNQEETYFASDFISPYVVNHSFIDIKIKPRKITKNTILICNGSKDFVEITLKFKK